MSNFQIVNSHRIDLVDALRGFAMFAIVLIHNLEHYNLYFTPEGFPAWLSMLDKGVWDITWFVIAGKAFSTFSLLFGFSFFIQLSNSAKRGESFRWRFAWRMLLLLLISQLHAIFYNGDILLMYAVMGLVLIPFSRLSNKWLIVVSVVLLLQPIEWFHIISASCNPDYVIPVNNWEYYGDLAGEVMKNGNFVETVASNLTEGQLYNNLWQLGAGRPCQIPALFLFGMLLGRLNYFKKSAESTRFWVTVAIVAVSLLVLPLNILKNYVPTIIENESILTSYNIVFNSLWNFVFMAVLISCFSLLWFYFGNGHKFQRFIIPYGRMSLTNYITQSIIGCWIYLSWGLCLYKYTGATFSIIIGVAIFVLQLQFSKFWLKRHKQGPLEWLWNKLTRIKIR